MKNRNHGETVGAFCSWMQSVGITYTREAIDIVGTSPGTLSIVAVDDIPEETILAKIPKESCITVRTTKISDILEEEGLAGGLGLVIAVWFERGIGKASTWAGYFDSLSKRENLPIFWKDTEICLLQGTEIQPSHVMSDRDDVLDDYRGHVVPLMEKYPDVFGQISDIDEWSFVEAASLVASRAFGVDDIHGDGMVPLADVFNHKVSVVELSEEYRIHGAESDSSKEIEEENESEGSSPSSTYSGGSLHLPQPCAHLKGENILERCGMRQANGLDLRLHIAIIDDGRNDCLQIISASPLCKGKEVFNTYGELGNAELVKKYGFCVPENPFTYVHLDKQYILKYMEEFLETRNPRKRAKGPKLDDMQRFQKLCCMMRDQTELLSESDGEEPFLIYPGGYVSLTVYVFVFLVILGLGDEDIDNLENSLSMNSDLMEALEESVPVSFHRVVTQSCRDDVISSNRENREEIGKVCVSAFAAAARKRQDMSKKTHGTRESTAFHVASTLRSSELCILDSFIQSTGII